MEFSDVTTSPSLTTSADESGSQQLSEKRQRYATLKNQLRQVEKQHQRAIQLRGATSLTERKMHFIKREMKELERRIPGQL